MNIFKGRLTISLRLLALFLTLICVVTFLFFPRVEIHFLVCEESRFGTTQVSPGTTIWLCSDSECKTRVTCGRFVRATSSNEGAICLFTRYRSLWVDSKTEYSLGVEDKRLKGKEFEGLTWWFND